MRTLIFNFSYLGFNKYLSLIDILIVYAYIQHNYCRAFGVGLPYFVIIFVLNVQFL